MRKKKIEEAKGLERERERASARDKREGSGGLFS